MTRQSIKKSVYLFYAGWIIYITVNILLQQSSFKAFYDTNSIYNTLQILISVLLLLKVLIFDKLAYKNLIIILAVFCVLLFNAVKISSFFMLFSFILVISAHNINIQQFLTVDRYMRYILLALILLLIAVGILDNYSREINQITKNAVGFYHPNVFGIFIISILINWIAAHYDKMKQLHYVGIGFILFLVNIICASRTSIYSCILILILSIIFKSKNNLIDYKVVRWCFILLAPLCALVSYLLSLFYSRRNPFLDVINTLLTNRLNWSKKFLLEYGLTPFGTKIETISSRLADEINSTQAKILDMAYIRIGINYGIVVLVIFCIMLVILQKKLIDNKQIGLLLCSSFFITLGISENYLFHPVFNFMMVALYIDKDFLFIHSAPRTDSKPVLYRQRRFANRRLTKKNVI